MEAEDKSEVGMMVELVVKLAVALVVVVDASAKEQTRRKTSLARGERKTILAKMMRPVYSLQHQFHEQ